MRLNKKISVILLAVLAFMLAACGSTSYDVSPLVGTVAPDFELENALGGTTSLSDYSGKPVLLFFHMAVG